MRKGVGLCRFYHLSTDQSGGQHVGMVRHARLRGVRVASPDDVCTHLNSANSPKWAMNIVLVILVA